MNGEEGMAFFSLFKKNSWMRKRGMGCGFFFSLFYYLEFIIIIIIYSWRGKGAWFLLKNKILHLKGGRGHGFIYLQFFVFLIIYILLSHFLTPKGWRVVRVLFFFLFVNFLYCVLSFCYHFYSCRGKGVWVYFSFFKLLLFIF